MKYLVFIVALVGLISVLYACDSKEQPFKITNDLPQLVDIQILEVTDGGLADNTDRKTRLRFPIRTPLLIAQADQQFEPSVQLRSGETASIFTDGFVSRRFGYVIVVTDETYEIGKELYRQEFIRKELIDRKFKLTIIGGKGIIYSP